MATLQQSYEAQSFRVIHPLEDAAEKKCTSQGLGTIAMTRPVRISLMILRGYLTGMTLLLGYYIFGLLR